MNFLCTFKLDFVPNGSLALFPNRGTSFLLLFNLANKKAVKQLTECQREEFDNARTFFPSYKAKILRKYSILNLKINSVLSKIELEDFIEINFNIFLII